MKFMMQGIGSSLTPREKRKAGNAAISALRRGNECKSIETLMHTYSYAQALHYIKIYNENKPSDEVMSIRRAADAGYQAGRRGSPAKTLQEIMTIHNYTEQQALAFLERYNKTAGATSSEQKNRLIQQRAKYAAANPNNAEKSKEMLKCEGYNSDEIEVYHETYQLERGRQELAEPSKAPAKTLRRNRRKIAKRSDSGNTALNVSSSSDLTPPRKTQSE